MVDFSARAVAPAGALNLASASLRASGLAGWSGVFWFTAYQLNTSGAVIDERVWELTPNGFVAGLSLDGLRKQFGVISQYTITSPESGFFVAPSTSGESLWWINGTNQQQVAVASAFGGLASIGHENSLSYHRRVKVLDFVGSRVLLP